MFNFKINFKITANSSSETNTSAAFYLQRKSSKIKILTVIFLATAFSSISNQSWAKSTINQNYKFQNVLIAQQFTGWISKLFGKRPTKTNSARSLICPVSPGLVDNMISWHEKPLFLWHGQLESDKSPDAKLIIREFESQKVIWESGINITQEKMLYNGTKQLQPGKLYQWLITKEPEEIVKPTLFRIMSDAERGKINIDLQEIEVKLKANKASPEEIALKKAEYFLNYEVPNQTKNKSTHLWSDAILLFYSVENPSPLLQQEREKLVKDICESSVSTNKTIS